MKPEADGTDRLILQEAAERLADTIGSIAVLDDASGALACEVVERFPTKHVRVFCDSLLAEQAVTAAATGLGVADQLAIVGSIQEALRGTTVVLLRLPKSLAALEEMTETIASYAALDVQVFAGGRIKFMTRGMNRVLSQHFEQVSASLGQQKSRLLQAQSPTRPELSTFPRSERHDDLGLTVCAFGGAFAGTRIDLGTRLLVSQLVAIPAEPEHVIDLACGTGVLATTIARSRTTAAILAIDESTAACRSAAATAAANGVADRIRVLRGNGLTDVSSSFADVIVCNPPFHVGTARDSSPAFAMISEAGRVLAPGGQMWTVFNSHLPYRSLMRRHIGPTDVVAQTPQFCVTRSVKG